MSGSNDSPQENPVVISFDTSRATASSFVRTMRHCAGLVAGVGCISFGNDEALFIVGDALLGGLRAESGRDEDGTFVDVTYRVRFERDDVPSQSGPPEPPPAAGHDPNCGWCGGRGTIPLPVIGSGDEAALWVPCSAGVVEALRPLTDQERFCAMLESAGLKYETEAPSVLCWRQPKPGVAWCDAPSLRMPIGAEVTVEGHFYDYLYAYFDEDGALITMESYVASGPATGRVAELARKLGIEP